MNLHLSFCLFKRPDGLSIEPIYRLFPLKPAIMFHARAAPASLASAPERFRLVAGSIFYASE